MDTQKNTPQTCQKCGNKMSIDQMGRPYCETCQKNTSPKNLYEEALFDLKDYNKSV